MRKTKVGLWFDYLDTYVYIQQHPSLRVKMKQDKDPGYRFMCAGSLILKLVLAAIAIYGMTT